MKKSLTGPLIAIIGVNFIWGFDFIAIEYMMHYVSPAVFTLARLAIGSILLTVCCFIFKKGIHIKKEDMPRIFISGSVGLALYFTVEHLGTALTSASFSSIIFCHCFRFLECRQDIFQKQDYSSEGLLHLASILGEYLLCPEAP